VTQDAIQVEHGILERKQIFLPFERVQAVDLSAGPIHRVLGLVRVAIKTGAAGTQVDLLAVSRAEGQRIASLARAGSGIEAAAEGSSLGSISPARYLLLGATSGRLWVALMATLAFGMEILEEIVDPEMVKQALRAAATVVASDQSEAVTAALGVAFTLATVSLFWVLSTGEVALRLGNFSVKRQGELLMVGRGLLSRKEVTLPAERVQALRLVESPAFLLTGFAALYVEAVGHLEERRESTCLHPALRLRELPQFLGQVLPELAADPPLQRPPQRARIRFAWRSAAALAIAAVAAAFWKPLASIALLLAIPLMIVAMLRAHRDTGIGYAGRLVKVRSRWLGRVSVLIPRDRVQAAWTRANIFQRRIELASARVLVASGPLGKTFTARDLDRKQAEGLLRWLEGRP